MQASYTTAAEFFQDLNRARLSKPQTWIFCTAIVAGKNVQLKTFGHTYLQIFRVDGQNQTLPNMDCKVSEWKNAILSALN